MKLTIVSGRSGSGKSTVLHILEDHDYYCIDNLPASLLPSLAERLEDLPALSKSILARFPGGEKFHLTDSAVRALAAYRFRGNIRELRNLLYRAVVLADTNIIDSKVIELCFEEDVAVASSDLEPVTNGSRPSPARAPEPSPSGNEASVNPVSDWPSLKQQERDYIESMLAAHGGDKALVAERLGISERSLYRKLETK